MNSKLLTHADEITDLSDDLEALIDKASLNLVLNTLAQICFDKADHLVSNWQDRSSASMWEHAGRVIDNVANNFENI